MLIVSGFIYMLFLTGVLLLLRKQIADIPSLLRSRYRLRSHGDSQKKGTTLSSHLEDMLRTVFGKNVKPSAFIVFTVGLGILIFASSVSVLGVVRAMLSALAFAAAPYIFLRLKLEKLRRRGSYEGEELIALLISQYFISQYNIFDTLEKSAAESSEVGLKVTGRLMSALLMDLRGTGNPAKIAAAADRFAFGIGTNWGRLLAYHLRMAAATGCDISLALEDLMVQLREARALAEERKRINGEAVRITVFLIPLLYFGTVAAAISLLGLSPAEFMRNQFYTYEGLSLFMFTFVLFMLNSALLQILTNRKLDF